MPACFARIPLVALGLLCACGSRAVMSTTERARVATDEVSPWTEEAAAGVRSAELRRLLTDHWEWRMRRSPEEASRLGDHRYDDRLEDRSPEAIREARRAEAAVLVRARALDGSQLGAEDRLTYELFVERLEASIAVDGCELEQWNLSAMSNPLTEHNYLPELAPVRTQAQGAALLARYRAVPRAVDQTIENLRIGAASGRFANAATTRRVIEMFRRQLAQPVVEWPQLEPLSGSEARREGWSDEEHARWSRELTAAVRDGIRPAFERFAAFLEREILPHARPDDRVGVSQVPGGAACYAAQIRYHVSLERTARELHDVGLSEMARIDEKMRTLGERLFGTRDLAEILQRLRTDSSLYFSTPEEVEQTARTALASAQARIPQWFGLLPRAPCVVVRVPDYEAAFTTVGYYRPPHPDGTKPGEYFINTSEPTTRPRYEALALAFHESIPGHHLQIAIAQELQAVPAFRKHDYFTVYAEGWALYTERLAEEMGLYPSDLDRMGMLSYDAWRASRLVVDTGIHAMGWSREQAERYMLEHTALAANNVANEVDRYIAWPGQALAYKMGQLEILRLREQSRTALGQRFDVRAFHDTVLGAGSLTLPVLDRRIREWTEQRRTAPASTPP